jgi:hypothetical protein
LTRWVRDYAPRPNDPDENLVPTVLSVYPLIPGQRPVNLLLWVDPEWAPEWDGSVSRSSEQCECTIRTPRSTSS